MTAELGPRPAPDERGVEVPALGVPDREVPAPARVRDRQPDDVVRRGVAPAAGTKIGEVVVARLDVDGERVDAAERRQLGRRAPARGRRELGELELRGHARLVGVASPVVPVALYLVHSR